MARILDMLAFWRKNRSRSINHQNRPLVSSQNHSSSTIDPPSNSPPTNLPSLDQPSLQLQSSTFLVPDLGDIRPFVQTSRPMSMSDLLLAISKNEPTCLPSTSPSTFSPLQVKLNPPPSPPHSSLRASSKRKFEDRADEHGLLNHSYPSLANPHDRSDRLNYQSHQHLNSFHRVSFQPTPLKKPRLVSVHPNSSATSLQAALCDAPTSTDSHSGRASCSSLTLVQPELIGCLPPEVWYRIFLHNELGNLQALLPHPLANQGPDRPNRPQKLSLASKLDAALLAQKRRHDLARLCRRLGPLARHAAWTTVVLASTRMVELVARKFEAESELAGHVQSCILVLSPRLTPKIAPTFESPKLIRKSIPTYSSPSPSTPRISDSRLPRWKPSPTHTPKSSYRAPPTLHRQVLTHFTPAQTKKTEVFQSVLIPPSPLSKSSETDRNTKLNAVRPSLLPSTGTGHEGDSQTVLGPLEEAVWTSSLPSLFLSIARSLRVCCVVGEERVATRALKSLSVLASLLGGLAELYIKGGGEMVDVFALVDGLRALVSRTRGVALRMVAVSGPRLTLARRSPSSLVVPWADSHRRPSGGSLLARSTSSATSTAPPPQPHIGLAHLVLGPGLALTPEELSWLVTCASAPTPGRGLQTLVVSLRASSERASLGASVSSTSSRTSLETRRTVSSRGALGRTFERIGPSLVRLGIEEDWNEPLSGSIRRKVKFIDSQQKEEEEDEEGGILDEALASCGRLEWLSLPCSVNGMMYSRKILNVLPFTLKVLEIFDGVRMGDEGAEEEDDDEDDEDEDDDQVNGIEGINQKHQNKKKHSSTNGSGELEGGRRMISSSSSSNMNGINSRRKSRKKIRMRWRSGSGGCGCIGPEMIWKARSQAALFGLEKIVIKKNKNNKNHFNHYNLNDDDDDDDGFGYFWMAGGTSGGSGRGGTGEKIKDWNSVGGFIEEIGKLKRAGICIEWK